MTLLRDVKIILKQDDIYDYLKILCHGKFKT
jgi:hypothetical protein